MKPSARRQKGKNYENKIADLIHTKLLQSDNEYQKLFESVGNDSLKPKRDYSSGNFIDSDGDIDLGLAKKFFPFSIECKNWKTLDLSINTLLQKKITSLTKVWTEQALPQASRRELTPLIVFKANRTENFCFYSTDYFKFVPKGKYIRIDHWVICLFDDFMDISHLHKSKEINESTG